MVDEGAPVVEIRDSRFYYGVVALGFAGLAALAWPLAGPLGTAFFGVWSVWGTTRILDRRVRLRISEAGVTDESFLLSPGLIEWSEITDVRKGRGGLLEVDLRDEQAFWDRLTPWQRLLAMRVQLFGHSPAVIFAWGLEPSKEELIDLLEEGLDGYVLAAARDDARRLGTGGASDTETGPAER